MAGANQRITVRRGDRWDQIFLVVDGASAAYDLTGVTAWLTVKRTYDAADPSAASSAGFQISTDTSGLTITNAAAGELTASVPGDTMILLRSDFDYVYDVQIENPAWSPAGPKTTQSGPFIVLPHATHASL